MQKPSVTSKSFLIPEIKTGPELRIILERLMMNAALAGAAIFLLSAALDLDGGLTTSTSQLQFAAHSALCVILLSIYLLAKQGRFSQDAGNNLQGITGFLVACIQVVDLELHPSAFELGSSGTVAFAIACLILKRRWVYISLAVISLHQLSVIYRLYEPSEWVEIASFSLGFIALCLVANRFRDIALASILELREQSESLRLEAEANLNALEDEIEERQRLTAEMLRLEKSQGLQRLAGGIAHDLNNLLVPIMGNAELVIVNSASKPEQRAERILSAAQQAANLVQQLLHYSGRGTLEPTTINLNEELETLKSLSTSSFDQDIELRFEIPEQAINIVADKTRLQQILLNLVINATEAVEPGPGKVQVSVTEKQLMPDEAALLHPQMARDANQYVCITVVDNGSGMDADTLNRIFEPFYSSKTEGRGLGLAGALEFASAHGGGFHVDSEPGSGTRFDLYLPKDPVRAKPPPTTRESGSNKGTSHGRRVLVIEPDHLIRNLMVLRLQSLHYVTTSVSSASEAAGKFKTGQGFEFALFDVRSYDNEADVLIETLRTCQTDLPILLSSGDNTVEISDTLLKYPNLTYIKPPFTNEALKQGIEGLD